MNDMCTELLEYILQYVPVKEQGVCRNVCRRWRDLVRSRKCLVRVHGVSLDYVRWIPDRWITHRLFSKCFEHGDLHAAMVVKERTYCCYICTREIEEAFKGKHYHMLVWALSIAPKHIQQIYIQQINISISKEMPIWFLDWLYRHRRYNLHEVQWFMMWHHKKEYITWALGLGTASARLYELVQSTWEAHTLLSADVPLKGHHIAKIRSGDIIMSIMDWCDTNNRLFPCTLDVMKTAVRMDHHDLVTRLRKRDCPWNTDVMDIAVLNRNVHMVTLLRSGARQCPWNRNNCLLLAAEKKDYIMIETILQYT